MENPHLNMINVDIANWKISIFNESTISTGPFSIATSVFFPEGNGIHQPSLTNGLPVDD